MKKNFLLGALVIACGGFFAKFLGAIYRIPLLNIVGSEAFGMYQLIFPLYALFFTLSSTGIPIAISKMIAGEKVNGNNVKVKSIFYNSFILAFIVGSIGFLIICILSSYLGLLQGDVRLKSGYLIIAPSLVLVCCISCFRGFFQGKGIMLETAISQNIEQFIKLIFGLSLGYIFRKDVYLSFLSMVLAVTISEVVAFIYLWIRYLKTRDKIKTSFNISTMKEVFKFSLPVTLSVILLPLSQFIDSVLIVNLLSRKLDNAVNLYGIMTGSVNSFNSMPIALCSAIGIAALPNLSSLISSGEFNKAKRNILISFKITIYLSMFLALFVYLLSSEIINILYYRLNNLEKNAAINMLKISSLNILFLSLLSLSNLILQAESKIYIPLVSISIGIVLKIVFTYTLITFINLGILASVISQVICYFVAFSINLYYIIKVNNFKISSLKKIYKPVLVSGIIWIGVYSLKNILYTRLNPLLLLICSAVFGAFLFFSFLVIFKEIKIDKLNILKGET